MILIQIIKVEWTKKSRGSPGSTMRNSVPEEYEAPPNHGECKVLLQEVEYSEFDNFEKARVKVNENPNDNELRERRLKIEKKENGIDVFYFGNKLRSEYPKAKKVLSLEAGSWGRIVSNGRKSFEYTWAYEKHVLNIALASDNLSEAFLENSKKPGCSDEVNLY